jgi:hypothetical protein
MTSWTGDDLDRVAGAQEKYARCAGYVEPRVSASPRATTLKLIPRAEEVH